MNRELNFQEFCRSHKARNKPRSTAVTTFGASSYIKASNENPVSVFSDSILHSMRSIQVAKSATLAPLLLRAFPA